MTNPMGAASPLGQPGANSGYFQIIRPPLSFYYVPGVVMHPNVVAAAQAGTFVFKFGTLFAMEKASGMYKVAVNSEDPANNWEVEVIPTSADNQDNIVGPILPSLNYGLDPSITGSGSLALPYASWFEAQTDQIDATYASTIAVGDCVSAGLTGAQAGKLIKATTGMPVVGKVSKVQKSISSVPGGTAVTVATLWYKGIDQTPWLAA